MYKVFLLRDAELQAKLCEACGLPDYPGYPALAIRTERGDVGILPFYMERGRAVIRAIGALPGAIEEDFEPFFVAGRQLLNMCEQCGAAEGVLLTPPTDPARTRLAKVIGFHEQNGVWTMDLRGFFTKHHEE